MASIGSAQISPRILAACERLEAALGRLQEAADSQAGKVDASEVDILKTKISALEQDNLALSEALGAYNDVDYDTQFETLNDKVESLQSENEELQDTNATLKDMNADFSKRLEKLIGNVQQVLEEE